MHTRLSVALVALVFAALLFVVASFPSHRATGQDQTEERIIALETEVASQGNDISNLRKRVKQLEQADAPELTPVTMSGSGNSDQEQVFAEGQYQVEASCSTTVMNVYVTNDENGTNDIPVSISTVGDDSSYRLTIPETATYRVEVFCDGDWSISFGA